MRLESERLDLYHHYARKLLDVRPLSSIVLLSLPSRPQLVRAGWPCVPMLLQSRPLGPDARTSRTGRVKLHLRQALLVSLLRGGRAPGARWRKERRAVERGCPRLRKPTAHVSSSEIRRSRTRFSQRALLQSPTSSSAACATRTRPSPPIPSCSNRISSLPTIWRRSSTTTRWVSHTSCAERSGSLTIVCATR